MTLREAVRVARLEPGCRAILILFDADRRDCPLELAPRVESWAKQEAREIPCAVVMANQEYEAWFAAAMESLRGKRGISADAVSHPDPESLINAKKYVRDWMKGRSYQETTDQPALSAAFDLSMAYRRCRSFRRLAKVVGALAVGAGVEIAAWPPSAWLD